MYFVITTSEDGEPSMCVKERDEIVKELTPDKDGYAELRAEEIYTELPERYIDLCAQSGTYIIKGELVIPKAKKVVETFEID